MLGMEDLRQQFSEPHLVPSLKRTPSITWAKRAAPFSLRQCCSALFVQLEDHRQDASARDAAACLCSPQAHGGEG